MRHYLLDTTPLTALLNNRPAAVRQLAPWFYAEDLVTSIHVYGEAFEAVHRFPDIAQRRRTLRKLLRSIPALPLNYAIMEQYPNIRRQLRPPYGPGRIGDMDSLIAATALVRGLTLVTTDGEFRRVPDFSLILLDRATLTPIPN